MYVLREFHKGYYILSSFEVKTHMGKNDGTLGDLRVQETSVLFPGQNLEKQYM